MCKAFAYTGTKKSNTIGESIQKIVTYLNKGWPLYKKDIKDDTSKYWDVKDDLSYADELLFCGNRIVIPKSETRSVIEKLHSSHQGISSCQYKAKPVLFWPEETAYVKLKEKQEEIEALQVKLAEVNLKNLNMHKELQRSKARCECNNYSPRASPFTARRIKKSIIQDETRQISWENSSEAESLASAKTVQNEKDYYKTQYENLLAQMQVLKANSHKTDDGADKSKEIRRELEMMYYKYNQIKSIAQKRQQKIDELTLKMTSIERDKVQPEDGDRVDKERYLQLKAVARLRHIKIVELENKLRSVQQQEPSHNS